MSDHSIIAPSAAHIWGSPDGCRAYPTMAAMYPDAGETEDTLVGDAIHEVGAKLIPEVARTGSIPKSAIPDVASNGTAMTDEYKEAVLLYVAYCASIMRANGIFGGPMLRIEQKVQAPQIHALSGGTPDLSLFNRDLGVLYVVDLKGGHDLVEVFENWQLINYYAGLVNEYEIDGYIDQGLEVVFVVAQPRGFHPDGPIREWRVPASDLRAHINQLRHGAAECFEPEPLLRSGPHCKHCPARLHCPVAARAGLSLYESSMSMHSHDMTPEAVGLQLLIVDRAYSELKSLRKALETEVESLTRQGKIVPHWLAEPAYGRDAWSVDDETIIGVGDQMGVDLRTGAACTPNQAVDRGLDPAFVDQFKTKPRNGWKIVPDTKSKAKRIFS